MEHLKDLSDYKSKKVRKINTKHSVLVPRKTSTLYKKYLKKYGKLNAVDKYEQYLKEHVNNE